MSLHDKLDGILETQVTVEGLEKQLRSALHTTARFGPAKGMVDIGEGNGFASRCGLVTCDWQGVGDKDDLPASVVIKIPSALPFRQLNDSLPEGHRMLEGDSAMWAAMEDKLRQVHNVEVATYEYFEKFGGLAMPKMFYGVPFTPEDKLSGQICLEYMDNSRVMNFHEEHTVDLVGKIARALGKIQACSLKKEATAPELHLFLMSTSLTMESFQAYCGLYQALFAIESSERTSELMKKIADIMPEYYASTMAMTIHEQMGLKAVLVNGDLRTENVLINKDNGDIAALIDWQCTHLGVGVEDLHRIMFFALSAEERRRSGSNLVEEMYNSLTDNLEGVEPPYSLDKLQTIFNILLPHCGLYFAGGAIALMNSHANDATLSVEEKEKRREIELEKVLGAFEDVLFYHEKNKELYSVPISASTMPSYNPADGILETPVTWEEFEGHLRESLKTEAKLGENKAVIDIGDGIGFASRCALVTCDWVGSNSDEKLPKRVILKIPSILPMRRMNEALPKEERMFDSEEVWEKLEVQMQEVHNTEIETYKFFAEFDHLMMPKMFYGFRFEKDAKINGQLCMEFCENTDMMAFTTPHTLKQLKQVARALGKVHACSILKEATSPDFSKDIFGEFASTMSLEIYCNAFKPLLQFDASERTAKAVENIEKILPSYYGSNLPSHIHKQMKYRPVIVSGDLRTENVLISKDTGDLAAIIDWQCTHHGVTVEDLLRITLFAQSAQERRNTKDELIEELYNGMVENLNGATPPYTLSQMKELYEILFPHCGLYFAGSTGILIKTNMARPGLSDEEKARIFAVQLDKVVGAVEDIYAYDQLNKKNNQKITFK
ncbi:hypothetical protein PENTCL1PPCAC_24782, partial [Pristionchus entomophagus]